MCSVCDASRIREDSNSCYQEAESQGGTHVEPLWATGQGLLVSVAFVVVVVSVFIVAVGGLS